MLLCIQFPFADARLFLEDAEVLETPLWPSPTPDFEFVRFFGAIRRRPLGGLSGWLVESPVCKADRALSFLKSPSFIVHERAARIAFRRLYFDGLAMGKYNIGFYARLKTQNATLKDLDKCFLRLPIQIRNHHGNPTKTELGQAGKYLAHRYLAATTATKKAIGPTDGWQVRSGTPLAYLEFRDDESLVIPHSAKPIPLPDWTKGSELFHYGIPYRGGQVSMWIVKRGYSMEASNVARLLRFGLFRLNAEYECLRLILQGLSKKDIHVIRGTCLSEDLQDYLDKAITRIQKTEEKTGQVNEEIIQIARQSLNIILPGELDLLLERANNFRKHLRKQIEDFANKDATTFNINLEVQTLNNIEGNQYNISNVQGILNIESTLTDVAQSIGTISNLDQPSKDELKQLVDQLNLALQRAPADKTNDAAKVAKVTKRLVEDISKEEPDKDMVEITLDGLKKAAENIANVLPTVLPIALNIIQFVAKAVGLA
jgi:hypothetical protein